MCFGFEHILAPMQSLRSAMVWFLMLAILCAGLLLGMVFTRLMPQVSSTRVYNTATLLKQVQDLNQLVTVKYVLEKILIVEDVKWYGENRVLMVAHGVVKAGVDLHQLNADRITISGESISIKLPRPVITDAYLDENKTQVVERTTGILREFDKDLEQNARKTAVDEIRTAARVNGIIKDAQERAVLQLKTLLLQVGFKVVDVSVD